MDAEREHSHGHPFQGSDALLADAGQRARSYLSAIRDRPVAPPPAALAALGRLDFPLPSDGLDPAAVLRMIDQAGSPATVASAGPRYFGFVTGGALPVAVAVSWLLAAWDQNTALSVMSPVGTRLDDVALRWVAELLGLPPGTGGGFVTGATMANVTCLAAARDAVLSGAGWDAARLGLVGAPPVQVVAGGEAHATVAKALGLVGLGRDRALRLPVDDQGRIVGSGLPRLRGPAIVCLQAGNVNSGASDPFVPLIEWAREHGAWVHIDGAFGLWAAAAPGLAGEVAGVADADSWATDAHKWLNTTYDCGIALVRDAGALRAAMRADAAYLPPGESREPMLFTPQSSQRARGAEVWAVLASLGRNGVASLVERHVALARRLAAQLVAGGVEVLNEVRLNQVVAGFGDDERTNTVISAIQRDGTCWCGPTVWRGRRAMRISISNWATTEDDIDRSATAILTAQAAARVPYTQLRQPLDGRRAGGMADTETGQLPPGLDLLWGRRGRGKRGPRPGLSADAIVDAAVRLADAEGLEAVSMARVAAELGFTTMSLYRYVTSKEELFQLMWNASALGAERLVIEGDAWRERLRNWAVIQRDMLDRHPWLTQMPMAAPPVAPNSLHFVERGLQTMDGTVLADADKLRVLGLLSSYTLSEARMADDALRAARGQAQAAEAGGEPAVPWTFDALLRELVDERTYPRLHRIAWTPGADQRTEREEFLFGIDLILDGVQALIERDSDGRDQAARSAR